MVKHLVALPIFFLDQLHFCLGILRLFTCIKLLAYVKGSVTSFLPLVPVVNDGSEKRTGKVSHEKSFSESERHRICINDGF